MSKLFNKIYFLVESSKMCVKMERIIYLLTLFLECYNGYMDIKIE